MRMTKEKKKDLQTACGTDCTPAGLYVPPLIEVLEVEVERGFTESQTGGTTPGWGTEPGWWE